jgi:hypothetical protein
MILMSYILGLSLLGRSLNGADTGRESEQLAVLTRELIGLLPGAAQKADKIT